MKKISLKDVKNGLRRDEMRAISGGGSGSSTVCTGPNDCNSGDYCCGMPGQTAYCRACTCDAKC